MTASIFKKRHQKKAQNCLHLIIHSINITASNTFNMRLAIFFRLDKRCTIPFNYQYILSAWVYSLIGKADHDFAGFLHGEGYAAEAEEDSRRFKFFTFSYLRFPQGTWKPQSGGMEISPCRCIELDLAFYIDQGLEAFVTGLFREQRLRFHPTGAELTVERVETRPVVVGAATVELKTLSPIVVSRLPDPAKGEQQPQYLPPSDPHYAQYFLRNLTGRYHAAALARGCPRRPERLPPYLRATRHGQGKTHHHQARPPLPNPHQSLRIPLRPHRPPRPHRIRPFGGVRGKGEYGVWVLWVF